MLASLSELASSGKLRISIDQHMPLADASKAWDLSRAGHIGGKIILDVSR
jgi:NADPH:quinone reductase-like Zn-dependent oxidoreductase